MLRFARWKIISIILMTALAVLIVIPSLLSPGARSALDAALPAWATPRTIVLGLDLQGGSHILLEVDNASVVKTMVDNARDDIRRTLRDEKVQITGGIGVLPRGVQIRVPDATERARLMPKLRQLAYPGISALGQSGAAPYDLNDNGSGTIQMTVTDAGVTDRVRRAVDQ